MAEKVLISLDEAHAAAEKFLGGQVKNLKKTAIVKVKLSTIGGITVYEVEGTIDFSKSFFRTGHSSFKVQINAGDGAVVGYETTG